MRLSDTTEWMLAGLSARGRGNLDPGYRGRDHRGSIPVCTGQSLQAARAVVYTRSIPAYSGQSPDFPACCGYTGVYPQRGQGDRSGIVAGLRNGGAIPGWAGLSALLPCLPLSGGFLSR